MRKTKNTLNPQENEVMNYFQQHIDDIMDLTIHEISEQTGISEDVIESALHKSGFKGMAQLRYSVLFGSEKDRIQDVLAKSYRECLTTIDSINKDALMDVKKAIQSAKRIFVFATGMTGYVAQQFSQELVLLGYNSMMIDYPAMMKEADKLVTKEDLVIVVSMKQTSRVLGTGVKKVHDAGVKVIEICCKENSGLKKNSDIHLIGYSEDIVAPKDDRLQIPSRIPLMIICNVIIQYLLRDGNE